MNLVASVRKSSRRDEAWAWNLQRDRRDLFIHHPARLGSAPGFLPEKSLSCPTITGVSAASRSCRSRVIGHIPGAFDGTSLEQWKRGGPLYEGAVRRERFAMKSGKPCEILWNQREADSDTVGFA